MSEETDPEQQLYEQVFDYDDVPALLERAFCDYPDMEVDDGRLPYWLHLLIVAEAFWLVEPEPPAHSIQSRIIQQGKIIGEVPIMEKFRAARSAAWRLVVKQTERLLLGNDTPMRVKYDERASIMRARSAAINRHWGIEAEELSPNFWENRRSQPGRFVQKLQASAKGHGVNDIALAIGQLWVCPEHPLWLMQSDPAWRIAKAFVSEYYDREGLSDRNAVSEENFNKIKRDNALSVLKRGPITGILEFRVEEDSEAGRFFDGYVLSPSYEELGPLIPSFLPPGYNVRDS